MSGHWFVTQIRRDHAPVQLFCLPHAGAGASAYARWPQAVGTGIEVHAFVPAGRERRFDEKPDVDPAAIATAIASRADRPFALFGHSLGGRVAFEIVRELRRSGQSMPVRLLISGCTAPDAGKTGSFYEGLSELGDTELLARLASTGEIPEAVLAEPALVDMLLPAFRADFAWLDTYVYRDEPPLPTPISAFAGTADESAPPEQMRRWHAHTSADFVLHTFAGAHFYLADQLAAVTARIAADLSGPTQ